MLDETNIDTSTAIQGKVTGVIIPPPDIRAVVDKTATFVARNGKSFEQKILSSAEGKTPKFNFMRPFDPYHAYYEYKIREVEEGREPTILPGQLAVNGSASNQLSSESKVSEIDKQKQSQSQVTSVKASFVNPLAKYAAIKSTEPPSVFEFSLVHPNGITAIDLDIMKLTAQYTAANGRDFLAGLAQREQRNPQFDFLKPTHMLFSYFTSLVDSYSKILLPSNLLQSRIQDHCDESKVLQSVMHRWEWNRMEAEKKRRAEKAAENEKMAIQSIDWFDFTVVETIDFADDELLVTSTTDMAKISINTSATAPKISTVVPSVSSQLTGVAPPPPAVKAALVHDDDEDMDMDMDVEEEVEEDEDIKVVTDYVPRTAQTMASSSSSTGLSNSMIDPISGKIIPASQMEEHMHVQLLDPKYRVELKRFQEKQKETGFAEGVSIAESLKVFAKKRGDIFGSNAAPTGKANDDTDVGDFYSEAIERDVVQWDGHQSSIATTLQASLSRQFQATTNLSTNSGLANVGPSSESESVAGKPSSTPAHNIPMPVIVSAASILATLPSLPAIQPLPMQSPTPLPIEALPPPPPFNPVHTTTTEFHQQQLQYQYQQFPGVVPPPPIPMNESKPGPDLIPADEFASRYPDPINLIINVTSDTSPTASTWGLKGQTLSVSFNVSALGKEVKEYLSNVLGGMPVNKQQLKVLATARMRPGAGVGASVGSYLKDTSTLAAMNIGDGFVFELSVKSRGGGKK